MAQNTRRDKHDRGKRMHSSAKLLPLQFCRSENTAIMINLSGEEKKGSENGISQRFSDIIPYRFFFRLRDQMNSVRKNRKKEREREIYIYVYRKMREERYRDYNFI